MKRVLVIEDEPLIRDNLLELLEMEGYEPVGAANGKAGVAEALRKAPDLVLCDIMMPVMDGYQVLDRLRDYPETASVPFIFLTARAQREDRRKGMRLGADDYVTKPFERRDLLDAIEARLRRFEAASPATEARGGDPTGATRREPIVRSPALLQVYERARRAARTPLSLLLLGETGVGKDVLAHAVHRASLRGHGPFVPLNCAALPQNLLESELFGHERGAFTGAAQSREGLFETADRGTVFLDEVGELPPETQVKLLRVIEDRAVRRVGGRAPRAVDVRFVAATNRDLEQAVREGSFREDLYYRLAGIVLRVPPLRERPEDIVPLAVRFAENFARQCGRSAPGIDDAALDLLRSWAWPGNVRELRNAVEQAVIFADDVIGVDQLPPALRSGPSPRGAGAAGGLHDEVRALERERIVDALRRQGGNQTRAARELGISRRTLLNRLDAFGLPRPRKKTGDR